MEMMQIKTKGMKYNAHLFSKFNKKTMNRYTIEI